MTKRCSAPCRLNRTTAFTLVEVLVVLVLISILASMVLTAVNGVTNTARQARTRSIIATIDSVLQEQLETYKYRPLAVTIPDFSTPLNPSLSYEVMPNEAARVRLIMIRDLMRMELPDKVRDVRSANGAIVPPTLITAAVDKVIEDNGRIRLARSNTGNLSERVSLAVNWHTTGNLPAKYMGYFRRTNPNWTPQHQGAECLYLILASTYVAGTPAIDAIPSSNIADTDGDGVPEILDGWGRPLGFIRWPVGYLDGIGELQADSPDEFDPYRADFGFLVNTVTRPFALKPLVISAGPNGEFGVAFTPRSNESLFANEDRELLDSVLQGQEVNYASQTWPVDTAWMGPEVGGRLNTYVFPDPYLRRYIAANDPRILPGGRLLVPDSRRDDNISNYDLESTE
jgi:prepilin-type N-terminal cleavage/methylation domain-containing protein